jgi:CheY-like chemotaxis protein
LIVIQGLLKQTLLQVDTAESGRECLELVASKKYDIIFLDHRMPEMDGVETLHAFRKMERNPNQDTPVIVLTANAVSGARELYMQEGFSDYLSKPVDTDKLEKMLIYYLPKNLLRYTEVPEKSSGSQETGEVSGSSEDVIDGIDRALGVQACGSEEMYGQVLKRFCALADERMMELENYRRAGDYHNYTINVHALKSSARLIGAMKLSEMARELEECGDHGQYEEIGRKTPELLSFFRIQIEQIRQYLASQTEKRERPMIEPGELEEAFHALRAFVEAFDFDGAGKVISMLEDYEIPEEYREKTERLHEMMADVKRDDILQLIQSVEDGKE